jgi:hypothetical protein
MTSTPRFHSLLLVEEKLAEAEYFVRRLPRKRGYELGFELNAFLSAARSVTFLIQKELSKVAGFAEWWAARREEMRRDEAMRFLLDLRNYSQKEGRVSIHGQGSTSAGWRHWFASARIVVPRDLRNIEVVDVCRVHLSKLAKLALDCSDAFPFHTCPHRALTSEGVTALSIDLDRLDEALGYERGFSNLDGFTLEDRLGILRRHFDDVDFDAIRRLAGMRPRRRRSVERDTFSRVLQASFRARMHPPDEADF